MFYAQLTAKGCRYAQSTEKGHVLLLLFIVGVIAQSTAQGHLRAFHQSNFAHKLKTTQNMHITQT